MKGFFDDEDDIENDDDRFYQDYFGRSKNKGYTYSNNKSRVTGRWTDGFKSMSEAVFGDFKYYNKRESPLTSVISVAHSMMNVLGSAKSGKKMFSVSPNVDKVSLNMEPILNKKRSEQTGKPEYDLDPSKVDSFLGSAVERGAMKELQTPDEYRESVYDMIPSRSDFTVKNYIRNILNTERLGKKIAEEYPGYARLLKSHKEDLYVNNYVEIKDNPENPGLKVLDIATRLIKFPSSITEEEFKEYEADINNIKKIFREYGNDLPYSFDECSSMAEKISKYILMKTPDDKKERMKEICKNKSRELNGMSDEVQKHASEMEKHVTEAEEENAEKNFVYDDNAPDIGSKLTITKVYDNKASYLSVARMLDPGKAAALRKLFERKNKDYRFIVKGMKSGRFDTNKLAEAAQHVQTVYERVGEVTTNKICVGLLIDESGSMGGESIRMAREAAVMLNEVFGKQPDIKLFVYGHTADRHNCDTEILVYREPGHTQPYALGNVSSKSQNRDGHAILATACRIRKFTKDPGILIVLSDGAPAAAYYSNGKKDTRDKVKKVEKMDFQVIQIAINNHVPSHEMFTHFVKMTDIASLPRDLTNYLSKKLNVIIKEKTTI